MDLDLGPFEDLDPPVRSRLAALAGRPRTYRLGERITRQGDDATSVYVVQSGHLGVEILEPGGVRSLLVTVLGPGALFGEIALLDAGQRRTATIFTIGAETVVVAIPADALQALRRRAPDVDRVLVGVLTDYVVRLTGQLATQRFGDATTRLRTALCDLHLAFQRAEISLSQDQIADVAGISRATVNGLLGELEREALVARRAGRITVIDNVALLRSAGRL
jgi:CRP/FNR family transcriptional regulator, cyclic AMP receptor protein